MKRLCCAAFNTPSWNLHNLGVLLSWTVGALVVAAGMCLPADQNSSTKLSLRQVTSWALGKTVSQACVTAYTHMCSTIQDSACEYR